MNNKIKIDINGVTYETESSFKAFAFIRAIQNYDYESGLAQEITNLCHTIYIDDQSYYISEASLIDYICGNYHDLPDDYNEILDRVWVHSLDSQGLLL